MKFTKESNELPSFQITPMIDVVFLLLTFFVSTSIFSQWETELDIQLPTADSGVVPDRLPGEIIINLDSEGVITVNQHALTPDDLLDKCQRLVKLYPGHPVVIRSDKGTRYEHLVVVIDTCRKAGIGNLSFATAMTDEAAEPDALPAAEVGTLPRQP
ncbi:MAG: biopolymer transporter ExbD [Lentisphaerae bacterium]|jgi:biopolymer transport protein ExbD|nr:biopolymer transporter ExbD [Lentisphaerota bacterium]